MGQAIRLNTMENMPMLGFGVYKITESQADTAILTAVKEGYRLIDTAPVYKNEEIVGKAIAKCPVPREDFFITSKVWNTAQRLGDIEGAFTRSLDRLGLDYLDLYLIHWPVPGCYLETWQEMEKLLKTGRVRSIGVSNFGIQQLNELKNISDIVPAVNQIEVHPLCYPEKLISYCQSDGIAVQAYAPLARGAYLDHDVLCVLATKYAKTTAQIGLKWCLQKGIAVIPKSADPVRIAINADLYSFELEQSDMDLLDTLNMNLHTSGMPEDLKDILRWDETGIL